ncbi:MAG: poly(3-hydroxybutyrate) depolymerase [Chryseolinea sp.]
MMKSFVLLLLVVLAITANADVIRDSIRIDGNYRTFQFVRPATKRANASLVFVLHGSGGSGKDMMASTGKLIESTASENVLIVYPDGYKRYWNECRKAASSLANKLDIDEAAFFGGMIEYFRSKYIIDTKQVFSVGTSGGGHMCYKLALTMPTQFKAIAAIIANLPDTDNLDCLEAKVPLPVMIVNGTEDPLNKYGGGMMRSGDFIMGNVRSTEKTFRYWSDLAGYKGEPQKILLPDNDPKDGKTIERYSFKAQGKPEVVLLKVIGGKHDYPNDIDVHVEAWNFFKRQR